MMMLLFISSVPEVTFSQCSCKKVRECVSVCLRPNFIVHIPFKNATERRTRHALITRAREREREREERENHN